MRVHNTCRHGDHHDGRNENGFAPLAGLGTTKHGGINVSTHKTFFYSGILLPFSLSPWPCFLRIFFPLGCRKHLVKQRCCSFVMTSALVKIWQSCLFSFATMHCLALFCACNMWWSLKLHVVAKTNGSPIVYFVSTHVLEYF